MWRGFGRHGTAYALGEGMSKGLIYLLLIASARVLSQEGFAWINLYLSIVSVLTIPFALGLPAAMARFYFSHAPSRVVGTGGVLIVAGAIGLGLAVLALRGPLTAFLALPAGLVAVSVAGAAANALRQGWLALLRARNDSRLFLVSHWAEPFLLMAGVGVAAWLAGDLDYRAVIVPYALVLAVVAVAGWGWLARRLKPHFDRRLVRPLVVFALPLIPHAFAMSGLATLDQLVLQDVLGARETAVYAFAYRFGMALHVVALGFSGAWGPLLFAHLDGGHRRDDLEGLARTYIRGMLALAVVAGAAMVPLAAWVGGDVYRTSLPLLPVILYGYLWFALYPLAAAYLAHAGRTGRLAAASSAALVVNLALNYWLIPTFGPAAAAWTTVASYALLFALVRWAMRGLKAEVPFARLATEVAAVSVLAVAAQWAVSGWPPG